MEVNKDNDFTLNKDKMFFHCKPGVEVLSVKSYFDATWQIIQGVYSECVSAHINCYCMIENENNLAYNINRLLVESHKKYDSDSVCFIVAPPPESADFTNVLNILNMAYNYYKEQYHLYIFYVAEFTEKGNDENNLLYITKNTKCEFTFDDIKPDALNDEEPLKIDIHKDITVIDCVSYIDIKSMSDRLSDLFKETNVYNRISTIYNKEGMKKLPYKIDTDMNMIFDGIGIDERVNCAICLFVRDGDISDAYVAASSAHIYYSDRFKHLYFVLIDVRSDKSDDEMNIKDDYTLDIDTKYIFGVKL